MLDSRWKEQIELKVINIRATAPLVALVLFTLLACMTKYADYDLWWHLGSGLRYSLCFQILALGGTLYFLLFLVWKDLFHLAIASFLLYESFRQIRLVELFSLVAAPCFALLLTRTAALLEYDPMSRIFPSHLLKKPDWTFVYWDNHSLLYLKQTAERKDLINWFEYY